MAGVLACGDEALLGERSAGGLLGIFRLRSGPVHVMAPAWRRSRPGLRVHGSENIGRYRVVVEGIPATSVARTLLALAASLRRDELARAVEESERLRLFDLVAVDEVLAAHPGARGSHRLRQALDGYREIPAWSRSAFEDEFLRQLLRARLPLPAVNNWVAGHEVDCVWFEQKLAVELDGGGYHPTTAARERDPQRDADLQIAGFALLRVTDRRLARDPVGVMANVRRLLTRR